jgi:nucleotide-binding universal stress UspA family protein
MYERILVPLDGSCLAEDALPHAVAQAERFGATLVLLKVLGPLPDTPMAGRPGVKIAEQMSGDIARDYLEGIASPLREQGLPVEVATVDGKPYVEIVRYAEAHLIDLIVMTTRGQSGLSRWLLGSVTDRVVRGATVPLLLVQARCQDSE